ncbi:MAG: NfeD family protein [Lachnospiraceae bacterium]|jgi:Membrane protein implicated in regulation of membrane protease activity|nr:NfeD family protein [Lachnospiraceae bacterium]
MEGIFWLIVLVVMAVIEIITLGLTTVWFAGGALAAFIASLLGANIVVQVILFVVVSVLLLALTRPLAAEYLNKGRIRTNADSLIGKTAIVKQEIDNLKAQGQVSVDGQEWTARSVDEQVISKDMQVEIVEIKGVKLMVKEKPQISE